MRFSQVGRGLPFDALDDFEQRALEVFAEWLSGDEAQAALRDEGMNRLEAAGVCHHLAAVLVGRVTEEPQTKEER